MTSKFQDVTEFHFDPSALDPARRAPGISAFMRLRNGAEFLAATIRSHIDLVDEFVVVFNQSTDATPAILAELSEAYPGKLAVYHYLPPTHPPGSDGHRTEPPDSQRSFVNLSNCSLASTRFRTLVKIDDDHLAMTGRLDRIVEDVRKRGLATGEMACFSGPNLARDETGRLGVHRAEPFSGHGDIGFFDVTPTTHFIHHAKHETFRKEDLRRSFAGFAYWHLKFLKAGHGFANREIDGGGNPRFQRKRDRFLADRRVVAIADLAALAPASRVLTRYLGEKQRLIADRWREIIRHPLSDDELRAACDKAGLDRLAP